jgi:hypothetical protein
MSDIVERLRKYDESEWLSGEAPTKEAADEIEKLRKILAGIVNCYLVHNIPYTLGTEKRAN